MICMQLFRVILAVICLPAAAAAQDISGLWTGYLSTTEKTLPYEVVINKKNGAWVAYSHISFQVNGKDITSVKKLKVAYEYRHLTLEDDDLLKDNFEKAAPRKISQTSELDFRQHMQLKGNITMDGDAVRLPFVFNKGRKAHLGIEGRIFDEQALTLAWLMT